MEGKECGKGFQVALRKQREHCLKGSAFRNIINIQRTIAPCSMVLCENEGDMGSKSGRVCCMESKAFSNKSFHERRGPEAVSSQLEGLTGRSPSGQSQNGPYRKLSMFFALFILYIRFFVWVHGTLPCNGLTIYRALSS